MNARKERILAQYGDEHPGLSPFLECMTRAGLTGVAAFALAFSSTYLAQHLLRHQIVHTRKYFFVTSTAFGVLSSFMVVKSKSAVCQSAWLAAEDKVTYLTEIEKKIT